MSDADPHLEPTPSTISRAQFEGAIARAVNNRSRTYNSSFALSIRWERDNTNTASDTGHFQAILSTLNLNPAEVLILSEQNQTPGWSVNDKARAHFRLAATTPGKSIVLIHYAGHGEVREGQLYAVEAGTHRAVNLQRIIDSVMAGDGDLQDFGIGDTDSVFVLDCCYSHVVTRALHTTTRVVEILSASDDNTPEALAPPRNTLTGKLRGEIARRKRDGHHFVTLSDVMATIRGNSSVVKPTHHVKLGVSVCFSFSGVTRVNPNTIDPSLRVVFSVYIDDMTREQLDIFISWIESLPPWFAMDLDGVYPTNSTLLILQSGYALFSNLAGYPGVSFISEVSSPNCRKYLRQVQREHASLSTSSKENIPFSQNSKTME